MRPKWLVIAAGLAAANLMMVAGGRGQSATNAAVPAATEADPLERIKHPFTWLSLVAEFRLREEYYQNARTLDSSAPDSTYNYQRYRTRLGTKVSPASNLEFDARLAWEFRTYIEPESKQGVDWNDILLDQLDIRLRNLFYEPMTLTVGRQDLSFGNRWIVYDATTADGSRTDFFDAARLSFDWKEQQTLCDVIGFAQAAETDQWLPPLGGDGSPLSEQDRVGAMLYASNTSLGRHRLEGYFIYVNEEQVLSNGDTGDLYVFGARAEGDLSRHWRYRAEFAPQLGEKNGSTLAAFGWNSRLSWFLRDRWNHNFRLAYEYLSGDDPGTAADEGWDPLWGRRAQWSELLVFTFGTENRDRSGEWTNLQRVGAGWSCNPTRAVELLADYHALFANSNPLGGQPGYSQDGRFRGQLVAAIAKFTFSKHLTGHLWSEFFLPGDYYSPDHQDLALYFRAELNFKL